MKNITKQELLSLKAGQQVYILDEGESQPRMVQLQGPTNDLRGRRYLYFTEGPDDDGELRLEDINEDAGFQWTYGPGGGKFQIKDNQIVYNGQIVETEDCTPTWEGSMEIYIACLENPKASEEAKKGARAEIMKLAKKMDAINKINKNL